MSSSNKSRDPSAFFMDLDHVDGDSYMDSEEDIWRHDRWRYTRAAQGSFAKTTTITTGELQAVINPVVECPRTANAIEAPRRSSLQRPLIAAAPGSTLFHVLPYLFSKKTIEHV